MEHSGPLVSGGECRGGTFLSFGQGGVLVFFMFFFLKYIQLTYTELILPKFSHFAIIFYHYLMVPSRETSTCTLAVSLDCTTVKQSMSRWSFHIIFFFWRKVSWRAQLWMNKGINPSGLRQRAVTGKKTKQQRYSVLKQLTAKRWDKQKKKKIWKPICDTKPGTSWITAATNRKLKIVDGVAAIWRMVYLL